MTICSHLKNLKTGKTITISTQTTQKNWKKYVKQQLKNRTGRKNDKTLESSNSSIAIYNYVETSERKKKYRSSRWKLLWHNNVCNPTFLHNLTPYRPGAPILHINFHFGSCTLNFNPFWRLWNFFGSKFEIFSWFLILFYLIFFISLKYFSFLSCFCVCVCKFYILNFIFVKFFGFSSLIFFSYFFTAKFNITFLLEKKIEFFPAFFKKKLFFTILFYFSFFNVE